MEADLLPCDWCEGINGKLYAQGVGWTKIAAGRPVAMGIAAIIHVPYNETNKRAHFAIRLLTEDGGPFPAPPLAPMLVEGDIEAGRPPGMRAGEISNMIIAANMGGFQFDPGGYVWQLSLDNNIIATAPFTAG
jgi:hypothetical protein